MSAPRVFSFGSRLPTIVDSVFYLCVGIVAWLWTKSLVDQVGVVWSRLLYLLASMGGVVLWGFHWRQHVVLTPEGLKVSRGLLRREFVLYDDILDVRVEGTRKRVLRVQTRSGAAIILAMARKAKAIDDLDELRRQIEANCMQAA